MTLSIAFDTDVTDIVGSCCASRARNADTHVVHADAYVVVVVVVVTDCVVTVTGSLPRTPVCDVVANDAIVATMLSSLDTGSTLTLCCS